MNNHWSNDAIFYHLYPLGLCGAPRQNDFISPPTPRLEVIYGWVDHIANMGCNAVYLGPLFESSSHGYDTADFFHVDRRLGTDQTLAALVSEFHRRGIRVVLDGVFNHVGCNFWAFRDVLQNGQNSRFCGWFSGLQFGRSNHHNDPFCYDTWNGHESLVKLNLQHPEVRDHLLEAVRVWMQDFGIDGLRLDAADSVDFEFQRTLSAHCHSINPEFWLMGEVVHGDYRNWANPQILHATTNYECYKGLYSSLNEKNYFEIAYALNRQSGNGGIYRDLSLYTFADNHDVSRIASLIRTPSLLYPLYALLFTMPGTPSIYYGSEFGLQGIKDQTDWPLRPTLDLSRLVQQPPQPGLREAIQHLTHLRRELPALRKGSYRQIHVSGEQFAFLRETDQQTILVVLNSADSPMLLDIPISSSPDSEWVDWLNNGEPFRSQNNKIQLNLYPSWARILVRR